MRQNVLIVLGVLGGTLGLLALLWFLSRGDQVPPEPVVRDRPENREVDDGRMRGTIRSPSEALQNPSEVEAATGDVVDSPYPLAYRKALSGITGRVIEEDGSPVPEKIVTLLEVEPLSFLSNLNRIFEPDFKRPVDIELAVCTTDDEGRFRFGGALARAFHGLAVDLGGPRATLRFLDFSFRKGETLDIGDIVLAGGVDLSGRVVDAEGVGVADARVRILAVPALAFQTGVQHLRKESRLAVLTGGEKLMFELPSQVMAYLDRLPFPTTFTDEEGYFKVEQVPEGLVTTIVDRVEYLTLTHGPTPLGRKAAQDLGTLTLSSGVTLNVRTLDPSGEPVIPGQVVGGRMGAFGGVAVVQPAYELGEGRFAIDHQPALGPAVFAARMNPIQPWTIVGPVYEDREVEITIPPPLTLTIYLRDGNGEVVADADLRIRPEAPFGGQAPLPLFPFLDLEPQITKVEDGHYVAGGLGESRYEILGRAPGATPVGEKVELDGESKEVTLVFRGGEEHEVLVIDDGTEEPLEYALVSLFGSSPGDSSLDQGRTDRRGLATIGPVDPESALDPGNELRLSVEHPAYGTHSEPVDPVANPQVVRLRPGGALAGELHEGGARPERIYMITLSRQGAGRGIDLPTFAVSDPEGQFKFSNLAAGDYRYEVTDRFLDGDIVSMMASRFAGRGMGSNEVARGEVTIREGETTEVSIDVDPGPTGIVRGWVRINGRLQSGARVLASHTESRVRREDQTNSDGSFDLGEVPIGKARLSVDGPRTGGAARTRNLWAEEIEIETDAVIEVGIEFNAAEVGISTVDKVTGEVVPNVRIRVQGIDEQTRSQGAFLSSDGGGLAQVLLSKSGRFNVVADDQRYGKARETIEIRDGSPSEGDVVLAMDLGVPCRGKVVLDASFSQEESPSSNGIYLVVSSAENEEPGSWRESAWLRNGETEFAFTGLSPGTYSAKVYARGWSKPVAFELGDGGDTDLSLSFSKP